MIFSGLKLPQIYPYRSRYSLNHFMYQQQIAESLRCFMFTRAYDMTMDVALSSLKVEDLSRFKNEKVLIVSESQDGTACLELKLVKIENVLSKKFSGAGLEIMIELRELRVNLDTFVLYRAEPYIQTALAVLQSEDDDEDDSFDDEETLQAALEPLQSISRTVSRSYSNSSFGPGSPHP